MNQPALPFPPPALCLRAAVMGIDPGASGGICVLWPDGSADLLPMPQTPADILAALRSALARAASLGLRAVAYVEDVGHGMPGQSSSATAKFARHCGHVEMALIAAPIPFVKVVPGKWMRSLGLGSRGACPDRRAWKNRLKARAQELFPSARPTLSTCDAALIAWYGARQERPAAPAT